MIDFVIGGQYGDEGKGSVAAYLAHTNNYYFSVRVGGSNAEHRFKTPDNITYTARVLPTAAWLNPHIKLVLGAGHVIRLDTLLKEIEELDQKWGAGTTKNRLWIDHQAAIVPANIENTDNSWRGTTHQGIGKTVAQKVLRDGTFKLPALSDFQELHPHHLCDVASIMYHWLKNGNDGLFEGGQGQLLSLNHGFYPYCTAQDTTPAALLGQAGLPTKFVRHIYSVFRTVPMRVPGNSGPTSGKEFTWEQLEQGLNRELPEALKRQTDSGNRERVFSWSFADYQKSLEISGPTHIVLTFVDWWVPELNDGMPIEELKKNMAQMADVDTLFMVRNGPNWEDYEIS